MTTNPLLADTDLPDFAAVRPEHLVPAVETLIADARAAADRIGGSNASDFESVVLASERAGFAIARGWSPASHLHSVADTPNSAPPMPGRRRCSPNMAWRPDRIRACSPPSTASIWRP